MALTQEQLQTKLDELDEAAASPELEVQTAEGKRVKFDSLAQIQKRRAHIMALMGQGRRSRVILGRFRDDTSC